MSTKPPETREVIWPFADEIKARGWLRARDYGHATLLYRRSQTRTPFLIVAIVLFILFIFGGVLSIYTLASKQQWDWLMFFAAASPFVIIYYVIIKPYVDKWLVLRRVHAQGLDPAIWTFSTKGIQLTDHQSDTHLKWNLVYLGIVTDRYVLLGLGDKTGFIYHTFASPMFETPTDWHHFRSAIIRNFIGCRGCKYDLHGTTSDTCPECGKPIDNLA